jgi:hypothetical protein
MKSAYKNLRSCIFQHPKFLLDMSPKMIDIAERMLPYSTGIEIESKYNYSGGICEYDNLLRTVPNIMEADCDGYEQRIRIPSGVKGMICLYNVLQIMKANSTINPQSGIHYHIDFTDVWDDFKKQFINTWDDTNEEFKKHEKWILNALKSWNYKGIYNKWEIDYSSCSSSVVRFQNDFKTMEIRIGEMTFDYPLMIKRIIHAQKIARRLKYLLSLKSPQLNTKKDESAKTTIRRNRGLFETSTTEW